MSGKKGSGDIVSGALWSSSFVQLLIEEGQRRGVSFEELFPLGKSDPSGQALREAFIRVVVAHRVPKSVPPSQTIPKSSIVCRATVMVDRIRPLEVQIAELISDGLLAQGIHEVTSENYPSDALRSTSVTLGECDFGYLKDYRQVRQAMKGEGAIYRGADPYELLAYIRNNATVGTEYHLIAPHQTWQDPKFLRAENAPKVVYSAASPGRAISSLDIAIADLRLQQRILVVCDPLGLAGRV